MPEKEDYAKGHRYPYYSCDILCSINGLNLEKILNTNCDDNNDNIDNEEKKENNEENNEKSENAGNLDKNKNKEDSNSEKKEILEEKEKNDKKKEENDEKEVDIKKTVDEKMDIDDEEFEMDNKTLKDKKKEEPNYTLLYSVLDHFFSFLKEKSSLDNYVLMGYFNKITNFLVKTKTKIILDYILINRENIINELLSHINRYSISNILTNILNALSEDNTPDANEKYMMIVNKLIEQFNNSENDNNTIEIISELIINCIIYNNKIKLSKITDANIIIKFENTIQKYYENYEENKNKILSVINLLIKMNKSILSNFTNKITSTKNCDDNKNEMMNLIKLADKSTNQYTSLNNTRFDFKELVYKAFLNNYSNYCNSINNICLAIINNLIKQEQNKKDKKIDIKSSYSSNNIEVLGCNKLIEIEFIITAFDLYINCLGIFSEDNQKINFIDDKIQLLINNDIFKLIIEYYFKYKNNNFYNNIVLDLIKIVFENDKAPEKLILNILQLYNQKEEIKDNNFISLLIDDLIKNTKFIFDNSNNTMNSLLFGSDITILNYIFSCKNIYMNSIFEKMKKEKFFYESFITNINHIFSKRLYKIDDYTERPKFDYLGVRLGGSNSGQGNSDLPFSLESIYELTNFYLKVYDKYLAGEDYISLYKERENKLEEIKKSNEYIRLGNQTKDEESETEEEDDEDDGEDIPKPVFFNSKLDNAKKEKETKNENKNENKNEEENENEINNQKYNDVNYWHTEIKDEKMDEILKELL